MNPFPETAAAPQHSPVYSGRVAGGSHDSLCVETDCQSGVSSVNWI